MCFYKIQTGSQCEALKNAIYNVPMVAILMSHYWHSCNLALKKKINKIFIFQLFTNHSRNFKSELQHKHFLPAHTQFNSNNN